MLLQAFGFRGAMSRSTYLLYGTVFPWLLIFAGLLSILPLLEFNGGGTLSVDEVKQSFYAAVFLVPLVLMATWVSAVTSVRRLHDLGYSGWWALAAIVVAPLPYLGIFLYLAYVAFLVFARGRLAAKPSKQEWCWILGSLVLVLSIFAFEVNRIYGQNPMNKDSSEVVCEPMGLCKEVRSTAK
jgi:uncharacterized membrane protein YhaH (DUF805 family)